MRETMWATNVRDELSGKLLWACSTEGDKGDGDTLADITLAAGTFPEGARLVISEPDAAPHEQIETMADEVVACSGGSRGTVYAALMDAFVMGRDGISYAERQERQRQERASAVPDDFPF